MKALSRNKTKIFIIILTFLLIISFVLNLYLVNTLVRQNTNVSQTVGYFEEEKGQDQIKQPAVNTSDGFNVSIIRKPSLQNELPGSEKSDKLDTPSIADWESISDIQRVFYTIVDPENYLDNLKVLVRDRYNPINSTDDFSDNQFIQWGLICLGVRIMGEDMSFENEDHRMYFENELLFNITLEDKKNSTDLLDALNSNDSNRTAIFGITDYLPDGLEMRITDVSNVLESDSDENVKRFVREMVFLATINEASHFITDNRIFYFDYVRFENGGITGFDGQSLAFVGEGGSENIIVGFQGSSLISVDSDNYNQYSGLKGISEATSSAFHLIYKSELDEIGDTYIPGELSFITGTQRHEDLRSILQLVFLLKTLKQDSRIERMSLWDLPGSGVYSWIDEYSFTGFVDLRDKEDFYSYIKDVKNAQSVGDILDIYTASREVDLTAVSEMFKAAWYIQIYYYDNISLNDVIISIIKDYLEVNL